MSARLALALVVAACRVPDAAAPAGASCPQAVGDHDGRRDFDFELGAWNAHLSRRLHPLTGANDWVELDGTSVVRPVWGGDANLGELDVAGASAHITGLSLRLYDPAARSWRITFASRAAAELTPALVGAFRGRGGVMYDRETLDGRPICVRFTFSDITPHAFSFEQAFSGDGGATWEPNWIARFTRALAPEQLAPILDANDRTADDRKLDRTRHPTELLTFAGVAPGMRVADLGAGLGYTTELLVRAVGPTGVVYAQNDPRIVVQIADRWAARLARPIDRDVVRVDRPFDDPLPPDARNLDVVVDYVFYHDTVWLQADRAAMNRAVFAALRPGGVYLVADASARAGRGVADAQTLHRIEQRVVEDEIAQAGFVLAARGELWRAPADARDWDSSSGERTGSEDRFVLRFVKPVR